jgi:hypothetical protein
MLVTARVFTYLVVVGTIAMVSFATWDFFSAVGDKSNSFLDRFLRKIPSEQYLQLVVLPLCGAIAGGLISTAFPLFIDHPPWKPDSRDYIGLALIAIGLVVIAVGPLSVHVMSTNPKSLIIGVRIDRLKDGDWTRDSKSDVIQTIDKQRAAIMKRLNSRNAWFLTFLILEITSSIGFFLLVYVKAGASAVVPSLTLMLLIAATILCAIVARYWVRPKPLRSTLADLDSYRAETDKLSPPALKAPSSRANAVPHHHRRHDLGMAVGGLLVGAILARLGIVRSRSKRQG